jgi:hypothetical protein
MRPIARLLPLLAVALLVVTACASGPGSSGPLPSAVTLASAPATASPIAASPPADPVAHPSINARFAVGDGARQLALVCWGEGSPTVLLETGDANIEQWSGSGVVRQLANQTRVCTYDRAGTGTSDPPPNERRDAEDVVNDLKALLGAAEVDGPYVLVGRSFGGMIVTHYAETLPEDVVGARGIAAAAAGARSVFALLALATAGMAVDCRKSLLGYQ